MKKIKTLLLGLLSILVIISACKKDDKQKAGRTLDANFSFDIKPDAGTELIVNLYYTEDKEEKFFDRAPDEVVRRILSEQDIENGFTHTFEDFKQSAFAYVTAYVDVDKNKELSEGDIAICYYNKSLREVMTGDDTAENASHRYFVTMKMDRLYSTLRNLNVAFTFTMPPAPGATLKLQLYYAEEEDNRFFERQPNLVKTHTLTEQDIAGGANIAIDDLEDVPYTYAIAYVDIDGDGTLNHGDIAVAFDNKSVNDVFNGNETASSLGTRSNVTINMAHLFIDRNAPLKDVDGNVYTTVVIGNREWMVENLKTTHYRNGEPITTGLTDAVWGAATYSAYAVYPYAQATGITSQEQMIAQYGLLYNGFAIIDPRGLAPAGWRMPTDQDFKDLEMAIGFTQEQADALNWRGVNGLMLRSTTGWPVNAGTDNYGFKALPAGCRNASGVYQYFGVRANLWAQTQHETNQGLQYRRIIEDTRPPTINRSTITRREAYSVRCVRDL